MTMTENKPEIKIIGRCKLDTQAILKDMPEIIYAETVYIKEDNTLYKNIWKSNYNSIYQAFENNDARSVYEAAYNKTFKDYLWYCKPLPKKEAVTIIAEEFSKLLKEDIEAMNAMQLSFKCYFRSDDICIVSLSGKEGTFWLFPSRYADIEEYKDYAALTGTERKAALTGTTTPDQENALSSDMSYRTALDFRNETSDALSSLKEHMQEVKDGNYESLAELKAEIDRLTEQMEIKKRALLDELEVRKKEMEAKLEEMERTVFRLDSEIYAIRCYTGEVVEINQIRHGITADTDVPIVFYQKMRYLDEELGKIASIYNADFSDANYFEELIINRNDVLEAFLPAKRSIALVRVSKTGKGFQNTEYPALLEQFDKYHGDKVAILIRDGENLFIAWTDDDRINFSEDAFLKPGKRTLEEGEPDKLMQTEWESDEAYEKRVKGYQSKAIKESLGRYFVFSLLQGMLDRGLIKLPEKINLTDSKYVIFSMADAWISDNRYGTFGDMITRCNASVKSGDMILITSYLYAMSSNYKNDRGRGYADRTWDVRAKDLEIYPVNLVEHKAKYEYAYEFRSRDGLRTEKGSVTLTDDEYKNYFKDTRNGEYKSITKVEGTDNYDIFVSLLKENSWSGSARANFQVFKGEFINLTFMNSTWLEYVLINNKSGAVLIGGKSVDFAYTIPYIKKALAHIKKREETTAKQIEQIAPEILKDPEWPARMSEWMLEKNIHNFSEYRTKQFCKAYLKEEK